jgi:hypothetical protein
MKRTKTARLALRRETIRALIRRLDFNGLKAAVGGMENEGSGPARGCDRSEYVGCRVDG